MRQGRTDEGLTHLQAAHQPCVEKQLTENMKCAEISFTLGEALRDAGRPDADALLDTYAKALVEAPGNELPVRARAERWLEERKH